MKNKVTIVNHDRQFGYENWYTFHCPHCKRQIIRNASPEKCEYCGKKVEWKKS